jgi:hypothetical protein
MNKQFNNKNSQPNYKISGIEPNYELNGKQGLPFDQSSISSSGYPNKNELTNAVNQQKQFVSNYNTYKPLSTFNSPESTNSANSANLENLRNYSQFGIEKNFEANKPIMFMPDTKNKHETLYDNLNENLLKESIKEYRLNIDSIDRDVRIYPDPFNYIVSLGPVTNSGINSSVARTNLKQDLRSEHKNQKKKHLNIKKNYLEKEELRYQEEFIYQDQNQVQLQHQDQDQDQDQYQYQYQDQEVINKDGDLTDAIQSEIFVFDNPKAIKEYTVNLERSFNPYIIRDFKNVNYIKLDCAVIPKYTSICINECWDFCRRMHHKKNFFKDEYDRIKDYIILNDRYIPDERNEYNPLGDRFIQIFIKELQSTRNFGTNPTTDKSFLLIFDKTLGALYLKLIPYSATKVYKESLLGNITKLSIQFYDSWGKALKINTSCIDYEINQISNTDLIDPTNYDINEYLTVIRGEKKLKSIINHYNEIIKCFIMINSNIREIIPFYTQEKFNPQVNKIDFHSDCLEYKTIEPNSKIFNSVNIYSELDNFVCSDGFIDVIKISKVGNKKVKLTIDEYINNVFWYDFDKSNIEKIKTNIKSIDFNYRNFGFKILDILKKEIINIPTNKNFQNFLTFLLGIWEDELNTKIDYYV